MGKIGTSMGCAGNRGRKTRRKPPAGPRRPRGDDRRGHDLTLRPLRQTRNSRKIAVGARSPGLARNPAKGIVAAMIPGFSTRRRFRDLSEQEVLALAISSEEDDARIYRLYAQRLREDFPETATLFEEMGAEEDEHRRRLIDLHAARFGDVIPLIRREHVAGFPARRPVWLVENLGLERIRAEVAGMEQDAQRFYESAAARASDPAIRKLLGDLAAAEAAHEALAQRTTEAIPESSRQVEEDRAKRQFLLTWVQPGLAGLMDGSVSTLAPIFATAFATQDTWTTFLVGLAASVGAGISMGFTEAASDDGELSGRGSPVKRGLSSGVMTTVGGLGHALPYLIPHFWTATTIALIVVVVELWAIAWIQNRFMGTAFWRASLQVVAGGALVLAAGILIGSG